MPAGQQRLYRPDSRFNIGLFAALGALAGEIASFRSHILTLFSSDFQKSYRGAALGVVWNVILPLLPITVYIMLSKLRVFPQHDGIDPAVYIGLGVTVWFLLAGLIRQPVQIVKSRNAEVMKTALPLSASIAASFAQLCFDTLVRLCLVAGLIVYSADWPSWLALAAPFALLAGAAFAFALGLALAILNVVFPDVERVVTVLLQYLIFLSGVIFPVTSLGPLAVLETTNPFNVFIGAVRDLVFHGTLAHPQAFALWSVAGVVLLLIAARFFYVMEYRIRGLA